VEDRIERVRLRFRSILESAELAADWAAQERPTVLPPSNLLVASMKAMTRAAGFIEAVSIVIPELGPELLSEFETFASRVESLGRTIEANEERRMPGGRRSRDDRRAGDRRLGYDRRRHAMEIAVERRHTPSRRAEPDRRTGRIRQLADRRWRAVTS
jgi:hypothetical protein